MASLNWVYLLMLLAAYLYNAFKGNEKKKAEEARKKGNVGQPVSPQPQAGTPRDIFKEIFGDQTPTITKPRPITQIKKQKPATKQVSKTKQVFVPREIVPNENTNTTADVHIGSLKEANDAYAIGVEGDAHSFNLHDAIIASIILNRPEY